ncbi:hypothetical protein LTR86_000459 [Recurvomyces mirabilis]|nr:hypothetical protein LTR86_000459 [Recurvomyces mirabilis]
MKHLDGLEVFLRNHDQKDLPEYSTADGPRTTMACAWEAGNIAVAPGVPVEVWVKALPNFDFKGASGIMIVLSCGHGAQKPVGIEHMEAWWLSEKDCREEWYFKMLAWTVWDHVDLSLHASVPVSLFRKKYSAADGTITVSITRGNLSYGKEMHPVLVRIANCRGETTSTRSLTNPPHECYGWYKDPSGAVIDQQWFSPLENVVLGSRPYGFQFCNFGTGPELMDLLQLRSDSAHYHNNDSTSSQADDEDVEQAMPEDDPGETLSQYESTSNKSRGAKPKKQQRAGKKRKRNSTSKTQPRKSARLGVHSRKAAPKPAAKPTYNEDEDDEDDLVLPPEPTKRRLQNLHTGLGAPRKSAPQGGERGIPRDFIARTERESRTLSSQTRVIIEISDDDSDDRGTPEHQDDPDTFDDGDTGMNLKNEHGGGRADRNLTNDDRSRWPEFDPTSASRPYRGREQLDRDQNGPTRSLSGADVTGAQRANSRIQGNGAIAAGRDIKREYADASLPPRLPTPADSSQPPIQSTSTDAGHRQRDEQSDSDDEVFRQLQEIRLVGKLKRRGRLDLLQRA